MPIQRCLFQVERQTWWMARYFDHVPVAVADDVRERLHELLVDAYNDLVDHARDIGAAKAVGHLFNAGTHALTFLAHPDAGRLLFGHKGRPELATGLLERVRHAMNRRSDVGVRRSVPGVRGKLMVKRGRKYHHRRWSKAETADNQLQVSFTLAAGPRCQELASLPNPFDAARP